MISLFVTTLRHLQRPLSVRLPIVSALAASVVVEPIGGSVKSPIRTNVVFYQVFFILWRPVVNYFREAVSAAVASRP